jgi:hypothetical protein
VGGTGAAKLTVAFLQLLIAKAPEERTEEEI